MADNIRYVGNAVRKEKNKRNFKHSLNLTLVSALIIIAILGGLKIAQKTAPGNSEIAEVENDGYPVSFSGNDIRDAGVMDKNIIVLTKKFVTALNKKGDTAWQNAITYGDPAVFIGEKYTLAFDRYSNKYAVISSDGKIDTRNADRTTQIFSGRVTDKGEVLLSLKSTSSACLVSVIDKKGNEKFVWSCVDEYIVDMGLSSDGNTLYCAGIGASGGDMYTKVYVINMKNKDKDKDKDENEEEDKKKNEEKSYTIPSSACVSVNAISGDKFNVITTDGIYVFDCSRDEILTHNVKFISKLLYCSVSDDGHIAVVNDSALNLSENVLTVYSGNAKEKYSMAIQNGVEDIFIYKDEPCVLYSDSVISVGNGKVDKQLFFDNKAMGVVRSGSKVYCYSLGGVEKAAVK